MPTGIRAGARILRRAPYFGYIGCHRGYSKFSGASKILLDAAFQRDFELLLSVQLTLEYEDVLLRPHQLSQSGLSRDEIEELLASLLQVAIKIDLDEYAGPQSIDPDDNHVLSLAFQGAADGIVSHNIRHFKLPSQMLGVGLYTPGDALRLLRS